MPSTLRARYIESGLIRPSVRDGRDQVVSQPLAKASGRALRSRYIAAGLIRPRGCRRPRRWVTVVRDSSAPFAVLWAILVSNGTAGGAVSSHE